MPVLSPVDRMLNTDQSGSPNYARDLYGNLSSNDQARARARLNNPPPPPKAKKGRKRRGRKSY